MAEAATVTHRSYLQTSTSSVSPSTSAKPKALLLASGGGITLWTRARDEYLRLQDAQSVRSWAWSTVQKFVVCSCVRSGCMTSTG